LTFVELPGFSRRVLQLLDDASYAALQFSLVERPDAGALIKGAGGLRKVRWAAKGHGKSGGARIIYYWRTAEGQIIMADIYPKNEKENLTAADLAKLRKEIGI
jgi:hypothetical protein